MTARAMWKGFIRFGGFDVPVKLLPAVREERIRFHLIHRRDHVRLKQEMVCAYDKVPVPPEEQVRGFEVEEGRYILVESEDLERLEPAESRVIEVREFVRSGEVGPLYLGRAYYLAPDGLTKGYAALRGAMREMEVDAISTWTMRKHSYLGALRVAGNTLCLTTLRYGEEVMPVASLGLEDMPLSEKELSIGSELISRLTVPFEAAKFENDHEKKLQALIESKVRGGKVAILRPKRLKPTSSDNLLKALEASLTRVA